MRSNSGILELDKIYKWQEESRNEENGCGRSGEGRVEARRSRYRLERPLGSFAYRNAIRKHVIEALRPPEWREGVMGARRKAQVSDRVCHPNTLPRDRRRHGEHGGQDEHQAEAVHICHNGGRARDAEEWGALEGWLGLNTLPRYRQTTLSCSNTPRVANAARSGPSGEIPHLVLVFSSHPFLLGSSLYSPDAPSQSFFEVLLCAASLLGSDGASRCTCDRAERFPPKRAARWAWPRHHDYRHHASCVLSSCFTILTDL